MRLLLRKSLWRRCGHLLGVAVALCAYLLTAFGFPVPVHRTPRNPEGQAAASSAARPCGCQPVEPDAGCCCCCAPRGGKTGKPSSCGEPAPPSEAQPEPSSS